MEYKSIALGRKYNRIEFRFPFSMGMKNKIKALPDCHYDGEERLWWMPATEFGAKLAVRLGKEYGFLIEKAVLDLGKDPIFSKADAIRTRMYPFQVLGVDFLHTTSGRAIIADEMGTGKTIEALCYIQERGFYKVLIVAPASVIYKWQDEIKRWLGEDVTIVSHASDPLNGTRFTVMSYSIFTRKIDEIRSHGYQIAIYDECHYLGNRESQRTRAARSLQTSYFLGLSGTPFLNRPIELWPQLNIISPGKWSSYWKFAIKFCGAYRGKWGWDVSGATNLGQLKDELKNYYLRRTKQEVMSELPSLTRVHMPVDWDKIYARQYKDSLEETRKRVMLDAGKGGSRLQQIANLRQIIGQMKVVPACELAEDVLRSKDKVVLFAHHKSVVAALEEKMKDYGVIKIVGDTPQRERFENMNKFLHDPKIRVAIISVAGGEGIDLYSADTIIFVEREWNAGKEEQIEARLHRIGQTSNVEVIYLIARQTLDERIHKLINSKREIFGKIISIDDIPVLDLLEI